MPALSPSPTEPVAPLPLAAAWCETVAADDADAFAQSQHHWSLQYDQLTSGGFRGALTHVQLPGMRLVHERANCGLRQRGDLGQGHCGFAMTVDQAGAAFFKGQSLTLDTMMIGRSEELDFTSTAAFGIVGVVVERPLLHSLWERMYQRPAAAWLAQQVVVAVQPGMRAAVHALHMEALQRVAERPELLQQADAARALRDAVLMQWLEAIPERVGLTDTKGLRQRRQVVERACEVMLDQPDAPKTMLEVCAEIGVSPRKLEYCFRDVLGLSPNKYLRALRLNGVRRELKRSSRNDAAVQDIAARWGFWHLGDFSADYKRHFDELPSQTLRVPGRSVTARG